MGSAAVKTWGPVRYRWGLEFKMQWESVPRPARMLRIIIEDSPEAVTIRLQGDLAGQWVPEVERCWHSVLAGPSKRKLRIAMDPVTYVDAAGKALLREMHSAGAHLEARGALTSYIVEQIQRRRAR